MSMSQTVYSRMMESGLSFYKLEFPMKKICNLTDIGITERSDFSRRPFLLKITSKRELEKFRREISFLERN